MTKLEALKKAFSVLGGQTAVAAVCGGKVQQQHVWNWLERDKKLPERYAMRIHRATSAKGSLVPAWELCPEAFAEDDIAAIAGELAL